MHHNIIPTISTAHLPYSSVLLDLKADTKVCVAHYPEGGFVYVADIEGRAWLAPIVEWAQRNAYQWVQFDRDGDVYDGLPVYDWDLPATLPNAPSMFDKPSKREVPIPVITIVPGPEPLPFEHAGSISHGTMRTQDLIPRFLEVLHKLDPATHDEIEQQVPADARATDIHEWWGSEDASYFLNESLFNALNECAPEGWYFGSHPADGSDYGFWEMEE